LISCAKTNSSEQTPQTKIVPAAGVNTEEYCAKFANQTANSPHEGFTLSKNSSYYVKIQWQEPLKASTEAHTAILSFLSPGLTPAPITITQFKLLMPIMGHGSIKSDEMIIKQDAATPYIWTASNIYFSMGGSAGQWVVDLETVSCSIKDSVRVPVPYAVE
jgi:hypothetical protein